MAQFLLPALRALDVHVPLVIYRIVGRRHSRVYVDDKMQPRRSGTASQRLSEPVYWQTRAVPGDQLQERKGGLMLVTVSGQCHPVRLTLPIPIGIETAFTHAERASQADCALIDSLIANRILVVSGTSRRSQEGPSRGLHGLQSADYPLVLDELPKNLAAEVRSRRGNGFRRFGRPRTKTFDH
jgi:hypothetical protein